MLSEHNPIAELIHQIQKRWIDEVSPFPGLKLVRWIIKPAEARLFEGFLKLESTEHGALPEVLVAMLTPFVSEASFTRSLMTDWGNAYKEDKKTQHYLQAKSAPPTWDPQFFLDKSSFGNNNDIPLFLKMLSAFQTEVMHKGMRLVVALFPHAIHDMEAFKQWLTSMLKQQMPEEVCFMIFDHIGEYYFDSIFKKFPDITRSLHIDLDMDGAVNKISKMGNPNDPEVKFRECILEMGQSLQKNDKDRLHHWGEKGLQVTRRSGLNSLYSSAHIVYAGMLFNFKEFSKIDSLLSDGLKIAMKGLSAEAAACKPLIIQYYGFTAASKQLQKNMTEAINAYEKQGDTAIAYQLPGMALTPYRQSYTLSKKHLSHRYDELLRKAYDTGKSMPVEEQTNSCFPGIAYDYLLWNESRQRYGEALQIDNELKDIFGTDWKVYAKDPSASYAGSINKPMTAN